MQVFIGVVVGAILGAMVFEGRGLLFGVVLGWMVSAQLKLSRRLDQLEAQRRLPTSVEPAHVPTSVQSAAHAPTVETEPDHPQPEVSAPVDPAWEPQAMVQAEPAEPKAAHYVRELVFGGNTAVRVGVVVLFFGVAFLLKYAVEHSLLPVELRLTGSALGGIALLILGWRLREQRNTYALTLQGGGIGILYLTVFAALRLYHLLPATGAFLLLVGIVVFSALLALRQQSLALAVLGVTGGFLAPILTSTGGGSHVMLFSYYALLNTGILLIGWYHSWRLLNLVGFGFTFVIGALWGHRFYRPEFFATTEPFLALFFLIYIAISVLFALRQPFKLRGYVDGTLVFGVPIMGALMQAALVRDIEYGLAWSALVLGFFYLTLAGVLFKRAPQSLRLLVEVFLALGVIFATLAIPLALDGQWTAAAWAVEGAGIVWVGVRQQRLNARLFGLFLVYAAGLFFLTDHHEASTIPVLNAHYVGTLLIAVSALFAGRVFHRAQAMLRADERAIAVVLLLWGLLWWYGGGIREIDRHFAGNESVSMIGVFVVLSCMVAEILGERIVWPALRASAVVLPPAFALLIFYDFTHLAHPFAQAGYAAWLSGITGFYWILHRQEPAAATLGTSTQHMVVFWLVTIVVALEGAWAIGQLVSEGSDWPRVAWLLAPGAMITLSTSPPQHWPLRSQRLAYLFHGAAPVAAGTFVVVMYMSAMSSGDPAPLSYLPLANPLDLATAFLALALVRWMMTLRTLDRTAISDVWPVIVGAGIVMGFVWLNAVLFRSLHHFAGIEYQFEAMFRSVLAQASLSLFWSVIALILVTVATRQRQRPLWIGGAALLGAVVAKLFLVDLAGTGTVARIVSFIGVGVLLLIIGYLAPVPPRGASGEKQS